MISFQNKTSCITKNAENVVILCDVSSDYKEKKFILLSVLHLSPYVVNLTNKNSIRANWGLLPYFSNHEMHLKPFNLFKNRNSTL